MIPLVLVQSFLLILFLVLFIGLFFFEGLDSILQDLKVLLDFAFDIIFFLFILLINFISLIEVLSGPLSGDHYIVVKVFLGKNIF